MENHINTWLYNYQYITRPSTRPSGEKKKRDRRVEGRERELEESDQLQQEKARLRDRASVARQSQEGKRDVSRRILDLVVSQPEYLRAGTVMWYIHARSEVRTRPRLAEVLESGRRIVVPYCTVDEAGGNRLGLWHLESEAEMVPGTWNIPEPPRERWGEPGKEVGPGELDVIVVPGLAFDRRGARMGYGQGYYDRLLARVRPDTTLLAPAFDCQVFDRIPVGPRDVFMDRVITERRLYAGRRG
jgi:5-formyltetrahydrofolate cyclo-ligase